MKKFLLPLLGLAILPAYAAGNLTLTFDVDGITNAEEIGVNVAGIEGVTASVKSCNADLKELADPAILCPNVNGNTSMDFILEIELKGLPAGTTFDGASMYAWAYNGAGGLQQYPWDEKNRNFTVELAIDNKTLVEFVDIDIAASVEEANEGAEFEESGETVSAGNPAVLEIQITSDSATNVGGFFGLETLTLNVAEGGGSGEGGEGEGGENVPDPVDSILGIYDVTYMLTANNQSNYVTEEEVEIYEIDGNTVGITSNIFSFINCEDLIGTYDPMSMKLTINNTDNADAFPGYELYFYNMDTEEFYDEIVFEVDEDGNMTATGDAGSEFDLWYTSGDYWGYFMEDFTWELVQKTTAVKGLESSDVDAPVVYYDLQGRKVANPSKGIFIRQQGNKATKVVVK